MTVLEFCGHNGLHTSMCAGRGGEDASTARSLVPDGPPADFGPRHERQEPCVGLGGWGRGWHLRSVTQREYIKLQARETREV